jgi:hypothetical protein
MCRPLPVTWPAVLKEGLACGQQPPGSATFVNHTFSPSLLPAKQGCRFIKTWNPWRMLKSSRKIMLLHHDHKRGGPLLVNWDFNRTREIYVTTYLLQKVTESRFLSGGWGLMVTIHLFYLLLIKSTEYAFWLSKDTYWSCLWTRC